MSDDRFLNPIPLHQPNESLIKEADPNTFICVIPNALSAELCDEIIDLYEKDKSSHYEGTFHKLSGELEVSDDIKNATNLAISQSENPIWKRIDTLLFNKVIEASNIYRKKFPALIHMKFRDTGYNIQKYDAGKGFYRWHSDSNDPATSTRQCAMIIYLNDVEEGGETEFAYQKIKVKPEKGKAAIFPTGWNYIHRGCKPQSGPKYIINTFFEQDFPTSQGAE